MLQSFKSEFSWRNMATAMVLAILSRIREDTRKKLSAKGYYPQEGYILQYLPVPPNCLYVPDISDGNSIMSSDHSIIMLRKVLRHLILRLVKWKLMIYKQQLSSISNLGGQARMCRMRDKPFSENLAKHIGHSTPWSFKHSEN